MCLTCSRRMTRLILFQKGISHFRTAPSIFWRYAYFQNKRRRAIIFYGEHAKKEAHSTIWAKNCGNLIWRRMAQCYTLEEDHVFDSPDDLAFLIPTHMSDAFTTAELATALKTSRRIAQKMAYCLDRMHLVTRIGKQGNARIYRRATSLEKGGKEHGISDAERERR